MTGRIEEVRGIVTEELRALLAAMSDECKAKGKQLTQLNRQLDNLIEAIAQAPSQALLAKLRELEGQRDELHANVERMKNFAPVVPRHLRSRRA